MSGRALLYLLLCLPAVAFAGTPAPASGSSATPAPASSTGGTAELGKLQVTGTKPLVELLRQMKTAINAPFTNDPQHYDDMVCRIEDDEGFRAQGVVLDCGT